MLNVKLLKYTLLRLLGSLVAIELDLVHIEATLKSFALNPLQEPNSRLR